MSNTVKAFQLRNKSREELQNQLGELRKNLARLRMNQVLNSNASGLTNIGKVRHSIARVLTVANQQQRAAVRKFYQKKGAKKLPLDLRAKKTRAIRRRLTAHERSLKTEKQRKKEIAFPQRKYAIKA